MDTMNVDNKKPQTEVTQPQPEQTTEPTAKEPAADVAPAPRRRGFALMDRARVRAIARKGGVAAHERGTAHQFTREEAKEAGRKGGSAPHRSRGKRTAPLPETNNNGAPQTPTT